ncbi:DUF7519 family protein [Halorarius halobius]|uniref:DUF7519 family protein n=1 Tax=Halorarius halobius TaxID=2962671 RepID=UPI0020CBCA1C|nr:hypothetical protein [Halorarius halobius]
MTDDRYWTRGTGSGPDRRATRVAAGLAVVAAAAVPLVVGGSVALLVVGGGGTAALAAGLRRRSRRAVRLGTALLAGAVVVAGLTGYPAVPLLVAGGATLVAWEQATYALDLGGEVGRGARSMRVELVHAVVVVSLLVATALVAVTLYRLPTGAVPAAVPLLLLAAVVLVAVVRDRT